MEQNDNLSDVLEFLEQARIIEPEQQYLVGNFLGHILSGVHDACMKNNIPDGARLEIYFSIVPVILGRREKKESHAE